MGILQQVDQARWQQQTEDEWLTKDGWVMSTPMSTSGVRIGADAVMRLASAQACIRVLAETVADLPLQMFQRFGNGDRDVARQHRLYPLLHDLPNSWQTSFEWREMMMGHALLRGDAYSRIIPGRRGAMDQLIPLHPDRTTPEQLRDYRMVYHYITRDGRRETYLQDEIFHLRGFSDNGIGGLAALVLGRDVFGSAIATEQYGWSMYKHGAQLGGILRKKSAGTWSDTARKNIESGLRKFTGSGNAFKTMLLEDDLEWTTVGMNAKDAEFLASRKFSVIEICRIFRVPPHMIQDLERSTNNNIEHQSLEFVIYTLGPWLRRWEQAIYRDLILPSERDQFFAEFNVDGLLRGDIVSRYTAHGIAIEKGFKTRNEVRRIENLNWIDGLDTPLRPLNMGNGSEPPSDATALRMEYFVKMASDRLMVKEVTAVRKAIAKHDGATLGAWLDEFYTGFAGDISNALIIPYGSAKEFAEAAKQQVRRAGSGASELVDGWEKSRPAAFVALGLMKGEPVHAA